MADYSALRDTINNNIVPNNGRQEITGEKLNNVLNSMVDVLGEGYTFLGVATTSTNPTTPEGKAYYLAGAAGTYTNFGNIVVASDEVALLVWNGTGWSKVVTGAASKESVSELKEKVDALYGDDVYVEYTKDDATVYLYSTVQHQIVPETQANRIRVIFEVKVGDEISASMALGRGLCGAIYATINDALIAGENGLQEFSLVYIPAISGTAEYDGYLCISLCKSDGTTFVEGESATYLNALNLTILRPNSPTKDVPEIIQDISEMTNRIDDLENISGEKRELFLGKLVQKGLTENGLSASIYRVSTMSKMVIPIPGCKLKFSLPEKYYIGIRSGNLAQNLSHNNYWFGNGAEFTFPDGDLYFRLCFSRPILPFVGQDASGFEPITAEEVQTSIDNGEIHITYESKDGDIVQRNVDTEKYVKSVMRNFVSGATNNYSLTKLPIFAHTSDVHGDAKRASQFLDYCDYLGVDAALVSGDMSGYNAVNDDVQYINDLADVHSSPVHICMGNHDADALTTAQAQHDSVMEYLMTKNNVATNPNEVYPTYYYKDFTEKQIRLISLNLYETTHTNHNCNFTKEQCDWFISVLASTPANYGVLVMFHSPEVMPTAPEGKGAFRQQILNYTSLQAGITGSPFRKIIDAFIGKTTLSLTYTSSGTTITTSADFTNVASGVEFIAFVTGHLHTDTIGYDSGATHKQLHLNVTCGVSIYGTSYPYLANNSDLPRGAVGATQDAFNVYSIDRAAKVVRIARVGSNVSGYDLTERKFMSIPYAD